VRVRPWAAVAEVPTADGRAWFKACQPQQASEPRLTAQLFERWPDRVAQVLGHDDAHAWLLTADAGQSIGSLGNPPELWARILPRYAELQQGERTHVDDHLEHGVLDLRVAALPGAYATLLTRDLPLGSAELTTLRRFEPRFAELCAHVAAEHPGDTIQHDDLHVNGVFVRDGTMRVMDWGDASIGHPFVSLIVTFRFLEEHNGLSPADPWFARLRDAYLEPWGSGLTGAFTRAMRVGAFAHAIAWLRHRDPLGPAEREAFDKEWVVVLRRALAGVAEPVP
jgi:Phosphotransferase enzyme family